MIKHIGLKSYLHRIEKDYNIQICLNDISGLLNKEKAMFDVFLPYCTHKNPYCMYVKSSKILWNRCLKMKKWIIDKCIIEKQAFYGVCHCGVGEVIIPIIFSDKLLGFICTGVFSINKNRSQKLISKAAEIGKLNYSCMKKLYKNSMQSELTDMHYIIDVVQVLADYIIIASNQPGSYINLSCADLNKSDRAINREYLLSHAVEYMKQNHTQNINMKSVASACHCSESLLTHIFKRNMNIGFSACLNNIRINHAKELLVNTSLSVSEVSAQVGFNEPNYFTNIFTKCSGISPLKYRKISK